MGWPRRAVHQSEQSRVVRGHMGLASAPAGGSSAGAGNGAACPSHHQHRCHCPYRYPRAGGSAAASCRCRRVQRLCSAHHRSDTLCPVRQQAGRGYGGGACAVGRARCPMARIERVSITTSPRKKPLTTTVRGFLNVGAGEMNRTPDLLITNELLYRLSYTG